MTNIHDNNFFSRIEYLLVDRKLYPWSIALGLGRGSAGHIKKGNTPSAETLVVMAKVENASIHWLLTGEGKPYIVAKCDSDTEIAEHLDTVLGDEPGQWSIRLLVNGNSTVILLTMPGTTSFKDKMIEYTLCEMISGPIGIRSLASIRKQVEENRNPLSLYEVSADDLQKLADGDYGFYHVLGDKKHPPTVDAHKVKLSPDQIELNQIAEAAPSYDIAQEVDELNLIERFRALSPEKQQALLGLIEAD